MGLPEAGLQAARCPGGGSALLVSGFLSAQTATWVQLAVHHFTSQEGTVGDETLLIFSDRLRILLAETRDANTGSNGSIGLAF